MEVDEPPVAKGVYARNFRPFYVVDNGDGVFVKVCGYYHSLADGYLNFLGRYGFLSLRSKQLTGERAGYNNRGNKKYNHE